MTGRIITCDHKIYELPELLEWDIVHTGGVPCDSFSATCAYMAELALPLHRAESFLALNGQSLLLHGIVDEYTIRQSAAGRTVTITGRGLAARLLDNESRPATYQTAALRDIVRAHVTPYGISCVQCADVRAGSVYTVAAGTSQWNALEEFCRVYGGFTPTFRRNGELAAAPRSAVNRIALNDGTTLLSVTKRENHYGVLSEVLVIDKTRNTSQTVQNKEFIARGGQCRRVLYTPGQSTWAAMRYTGAYQIARSAENEEILTAVLPGSRIVSPGDLAEVSLSGCGLSGEYAVTQCENACCPEGETTTLTMKRRG